MTQAFDQIDLDISEDGVDVIFMVWIGDYTSIATVPLASLLEKGVSERGATAQCHAAPE